MTGLEFEAWFDSIDTMKGKPMLTGDEYETHAIVNGKKTDVLLVYELDGYEPLGLSVWTGDGWSEDITFDVSQDEYDRLYAEVWQHVVESMIDAAEYVADIGR